MNNQTISCATTTIGVRYFHKVMAIILMALAHGALVYTTLIIAYTPLLFSLGHISFSALMFLWVKQRANNDVLLFFCVLLILFTSIFGAACALLMVSVYCYSAGSAASFSQWEQTMQPTITSDHLVSERVYERIIFGLDAMSNIDKLEPFNDILTYGTLTQKQTVLSKITRYFRPLFAPVLLQAVNAPENAIRVQAASALAKIQDDFTASYMQQKDALEKTPNDYKKQLKLALFCQEYAQSGILEDIRADQTRTEAIALYQSYMKSNPYDDSIRFALGKLFLQQNNLPNALHWLEQCVSNDNDLTSAEHLFYYLKALFEGRKFTLLRNALTHYSTQINAFDIEEPYVAMLKEAILIWKKT